jgi:hypothetical protein
MLTTGLGPDRLDRAIGQVYHRWQHRVRMVPAASLLEAAPITSDDVERVTRIELAWPAWK